MNLSLTDADFAHLNVMTSFAKANSLIALSAGHYHHMNYAAINHIKIKTESEVELPVAFNLQHFKQITSLTENKSVEFRPIEDYMLMILDVPGTSMSLPTTPVNSLQTSICSSEYFAQTAALIKDNTIAEVPMGTKVFSNFLISSNGKKMHNLVDIFGIKTDDKKGMLLFQNEDGGISLRVENNDGYNKVLAGMDTANIAKNNYFVQKEIVPSDIVTGSIDGVCLLDKMMFDTVVAIESQYNFKTTIGAFKQTTKHTGKQVNVVGFHFENEFIEMIIRARS